MFTFTLLGSILYVFTSIIVRASAVPLIRPNVDWTQQAGPHTQCLTRVSPTDKAEFHARLFEARSLREAAGLYERDLQQDTFVFNVSFNIIYTNETAEGGYVNDSRIEQQMKVLNDDFKATGISWVLVNTTRIHNPEWFTEAGPGAPLEQEMKATHNIGDAATLNVYTMTFNATTKSLGAASIPSAYYREPKLDGVTIRHSTVTGGSRENFNMGRTLTHEVGHWLGLFHTFEGGCDNGVGDNVADTPPQSSGSEGCPKGRDSCPGDGPDLINNFMDYSNDACMDSFTKGQTERMKEAARAFRRPGGKTMTSVAPKSTSASATATSSVVITATATATSDASSETLSSSDSETQTTTVDSATATATASTTDSVASSSTTPAPTDV